MRAPGDAMAGRRLVRYIAAGVAAAVAIVYTLIGLSLIRVVEVAPGDEGSMLAFGLPAAAAYAVGASLLMLTDRRLLWVLGAVLQVFVISMYFAVAPTRVPNFEIWGILLRIAQLTLLAALVYFAVTRPQPTISGRGPMATI